MKQPFTANHRYLCWQGWPAAPGRKVLTCQAGGKFYQDGVVVVDEQGEILQLRDLIPDEEMSSMWSWSHAPDPFLLIAIAQREKWVVDPIAIKVLFDNWYMHTEELLSCDENPTIGPLAGVDGECLSALALTAEQRKW